MYEISYGSKYEEVKGLSTAQVAKRVRADLKAAVKAGELPKGMKFSVRSKSYSGGSSIDSEVVAHPEGFVIYNREWVRAEHDNPHAQHLYGMDRLSVEARAVVAFVEALIAAYNYDGSDVQADYFNVNFYGGHLSWDHKLEAADEARARVEMFGEKAPEAEMEFGPEAVLATMKRITYWTKWSANELAREMRVSVAKVRKVLDELAEANKLFKGWNPTARAANYRPATEDADLETLMANRKYADEQAALAKAKAAATREANKQARAAYEAERKLEAQKLAEQRPREAGHAVPSAKTRAKVEARQVDMADAWEGEREGTYASAGDDALLVRLARERGAEDALRADEALLQCAREKANKPAHYTVDLSGEAFMFLARKFGQC